MTTTVNAGRTRSHRTWLVQSMVRTLTPDAIASTPPEIASYASRDEHPGQNVEN
jgi:hypothetical protein